uniref:Uncharacterized protein n=1 Tax=Heterorhabditis bacteriophora TaxID=37862 RepID=A0A1I7WP57_HETBA
MCVGRINCFVSMLLGDKINK